MPLLSGEFLEGVEAAPDPDHPVQPLLDELQHADDLGDALSGEVLEIAGLVERDGAVEDRADAIVVPVATRRREHGRVRLDLLGGGEDGGRRVLGRLDDGVQSAGGPPHALAVVLGAPERRDLALGRGDRRLSSSQLGLQPVQLRDLAP